VIRSALWCLLLAAGCRPGEVKDDSALPTDSDSPADSPTDSPVDTVTGATGDTGDAPLPVGEILVLDDAFALILGQAWLVEVGDVVSGVGDLDRDGLADIAVGNPDADWDNAGSGAALVFMGAGASGELSATEDWDLRLEALGYNEGAGAAVARAGDLDGDGADDLAVATRSAWYNGYDTLDGWLHLWFEPGGEGWTELDTAGSDAQLSFGSYGHPVLAGGGDVDGDGLDDLVAGMDDHQDHDGGVAWIFTGAGQETWGTLIGAAGDDGGASVTIAGDVDGDGYAEVLVGAPRRTSTSLPGYVAIARGGASSIGQRALGATWARVHGVEGLHRQAGYAVSVVGDIERDGLADISLCAAQRPKVAWVAEEAALLLGSTLATGGAFDIDHAHARFVTDERGAQQTTLSLVGPGDLDGDGSSDWIIGAPGHQADDGVVYVFLGAALGSGGILVPDRANHLVVGAEQGAFGISLAVPGDVSGDGIDDLLVGGPGYGEAGAVALFGLGS
jgi:hypothetical protein